MLKPNHIMPIVKTMMIRLTVTNTTAAVTFSCNVVPSGGAAGDSNAIPFQR